MSYSEKDKQKIFDDICDIIINGKSLRTALKEVNIINPSTFFEWIRKDEAKAEQYARATIERADLIFEDIFDIADDGTNDYMTIINKNGIEVEVLNTEHVQRSRLRVDARKWALSKMMPKKYGDKPETKEDDLDNEIIITIIDNGNKPNKKV